jgi:hypothetical protein
VRRTAVRSITLSGVRRFADARSASCVNLGKK